MCLLHAHLSCAHPALPRQRRPLNKIASLTIKTCLPGGQARVAAVAALCQMFLRALLSGLSQRADDYKLYN
jgi:hypothetical protein